MGWLNLLRDYCVVNTEKDGQSGDSAGWTPSAIGSAPLFGLYQLYGNAYDGLCLVRSWHRPQSKGNLSRAEDDLSGHGDGVQGILRVKSESGQLV